MYGPYPTLSHQAALNVLVNEGVEASHAQELLSLAHRYGCVEIPHVKEGNDSWGSHVSMSVEYHPDDELRSAGFNVKVSEIKRY